MFFGVVLFSALGWCWLLLSFFCFWDVLNDEGDAALPASKQNQRQPVSHVTLTARKSEELETKTLLKKN